MSRAATKCSPQLELSLQNDLLVKLHKLGKQILTKISWIKIEEGNVRFKRFKDNGYRWLQEDYEHEGFQAVYCKRLFMTRAELICYVLSEMEHQCYLPNLLYDRDYKPRALRVASFGCGPGNDLAGFESFFSNLKVRKIRSLEEEKATTNKSEYSLTLKCLQEAKIEKIIGYDSAKGWKSYTDVLGYTYQHQVIDHKFVNQMAPVDVVILSYFAHNAHFSTPLGPQLYTSTVNADVDMLRNWDILMQKSNLIVVVDTKPCIQPLFSLLQKRGFASIVGSHDSCGRELAAHVWVRKDF